MFDANKESLFCSRRDFSAGRPDDAWVPVDGLDVVRVIGVPRRNRHAGGGA
jgi:hypothetical protein